MFVPLQLQDKNMTDLKLPLLQLPYKNEIDLVDKLLSIYSLTKENQEVPAGSRFDSFKLRKFERDVLNYYIRYGYSDDTKQMIQEDMGKKSNAITQVDFLLKEKGYLEDLPNNYRMKKLNPYLEDIRKKFILEKRRVYAIHFKKG